MCCADVQAWAEELLVEIVAFHPRIASQPDALELALVAVDGQRLLNLTWDRFYSHTFGGV